LEVIGFLVLPEMQNKIAIQVTMVPINYSHIYKKNQVIGLSGKV